MKVLFEPIEWLKQFKQATKTGNGLHELRAEIYRQTLQMVKQKGYYLENEWVELSEICSVDTVFYEKPQILTPKQLNIETKFSVIEADCIETADLLQTAGYHVCVLNMASRQNPGGGVIKGAGAQEENIFRRSNIFCSMYQFVDYCSRYNIERNKNFSYPLNRNSGGIYSRNVTVFRSSEKTGYHLLKNPFKTNFVSVPALNKPQLDLIDGTYLMSSPLIEATKEKIRTILRIAGSFHHDCLVLSAFGCGAFRNPPNHIASLFHEVFSEKEFFNQFRLIVFSIIDDHNAWREHNPHGNVIPFQKQFE